MLDRSFLHWPFFEERHRALAERLESWPRSIVHMSIIVTLMPLAANGKVGRDGCSITTPGDDPSEKIDVRTLA